MALYLGTTKIDAVLTKHTSSVVDLTDATAMPEDILAGKIAFTQDGQIEGTIVSKETEEFVPSTTDQTIAANQYLAGDQIIKGDTNLVAENIAEGVSIFGVQGTHEGKLPGVCTLKFRVGSGDGDVVPTDYFNNADWFTIAYQILTSSNTTSMICEDCETDGSSWDTLYDETVSSWEGGEYYQLYIWNRIVCGSWVWVSIGSNWIDNDYFIGTNCLIEYSGDGYASPGLMITLTANAGETAYIDANL